MLVPMLIVPSTEYNKICPVIIGTNIIRVCRDYFQRLSQFDQLPHAWQIAIGQSCRSYCVRTTTKKNITLAPYQSMVIHGIAKDVDRGISTVITDTISKNDT